MSDERPAETATAVDDVFQLPRDTTPTWKVELLLSGALVFSMLQVPGLLDDIVFALRPRMADSLNYGVFMLYFYLKVTSYALIATFVLHLASRAVWVAALGFLLRLGALSLPGERYLPDEPGSRELRAANYAEFRDSGDARKGHPYIAGDVVRGPYLRLFVPYLPRKIDAAIERDCPAIAGAAVPGLRYDVAEDPVSGLRGFVAMIDVRDLPRGRHELSVERPDRPGRDEPEAPVLIPFWR